MCYIYYIILSIVVTYIHEYRCMYISMYACVCVYLPACPSVCLCGHGLGGGALMGGDIPAAADCDDNSLRECADKKVLKTKGLHPHTFFTYVKDTYTCQDPQICPRGLYVCERVVYKCKRDLRA